MLKKLRYLLFVLVIIIPLALAACGGDNDEKDDGDNGGGDSVSLTQSFEADSGVSVKYPEGWAAKDQDGTILLATSTEALDASIGQVSEDSEENEPARAPESGEIVLGISTFSTSEMGLPEDTTIDSIFDMMAGSMTGEGMEAVGEAEELKIGDNDARKLDITSAEIGGDGFVLAFLDENNTFVSIIGITATGERDNFDDVVFSIAESIEYTAPAAE